MSTEPRREEPRHEEPKREEPRREQQDERSWGAGRPTDPESIIRELCAHLRATRDTNRRV